MMLISEYIQQMIEDAPAATSEQSPFSDGWDAGYKRGLEAALNVAKAVES